MMKNKEYKFKQGFSIKVRPVPSDTFFAMGETHICEYDVYDLYMENKFIKTYELLDDAINMGIEIAMEDIVKYSC